MANIFDLEATISINSDEFRQGVNSAATAFDSFGSGISATAVMIGNILADMATKAISALGDFAKSAIDTGMQFDASMSNVKAISGATGDEFDELRAKAKEMGATTKFTATEAADAFSYMAMAGWKTEDMLAGIEGIMNLAAASGENLATTSDIVTDALTAFGLTSQDTQMFVDVLAAASSNANTNVGMMGETFKYVAPVAGALGYDVKDVATAIGLMANSGIKAGQAGTAMRAALSRLVKPTKEVAEALDALGLMKLADDAGEFTYNMEELSTELAAVDKAQTALNKAIEKYGDGSTQATEKAQKLAEAQLKLTNAMQAQKEEALSYNSLIVDESGNMQSFSSLVAGLREAFSGLTEAEQAEYAARLFGQEAMSGMLAIINSTEEDYEKLTAAIESASEAADGQGTAFEMAQTQIDNLDGAVTIFKSALDGLKVTVYDTFKVQMKEGVEAATAAIDALRKGFEDGGFLGAISNLGDYIRNAFSEMLPPIDFSKTALGEFAKELKFWTGGAVNSIIDTIRDFGASFLEISTDTILSAADAARDFFGAFDKEEIASIIGKVADACAELFGAYSDAYITLIDETSDAVTGFIDAFDKEGAAQAITDISDKSADLFAVMSHSVSERINSIKDSFKGFGAELGELAAEFPVDMGKMGEAISGLIGNITEIGQEFNDFTRPVREFLENTLGRLVKGAVGAVVGGIGGLVNALSDFLIFFNRGIDTIQLVINGDLKAAWESFKTQYIGFIDFFKDLWDMLVGLWKGGYKAFEGIGEDLVNGLREGFARAWTAFTSWVSGLVSGLVTTVKGVFDIGSPSKVFAEIGKFTVQGLEVGWSSEFDRFENAVDSDLSSLTGTAKIGFDSSAIGRSSAAQITSTLAAGQGSIAAPAEINLVLDGDVAAKAIYDPLRRVAWQKGEAGVVYA